MTIELLDGVRLYRWLFVVALGASLGGVGIAVASAILARPGSVRDLRSARSVTLALLGAAGVITLAWAILATLEGAPIGGRVTFENGSFARDLRFIAAYGVAFAAGAVAALALAGASFGAGSRRFPRAVRLSLVPIPAAGLALTVFAIVEAVGVVTSDTGFVHPQDAVVDRPLVAVSLGQAAFATGLAVTPSGDLLFAESATGRIGLLSPDGDGYRSGTFGTIELPTAGRLFHLELHPDWPAQPFIYATAHEGEGDAQRLSVLLLEAEGLRMRSSRTVVAGLPTENPLRGPGGDHYGSGLAACGGFLFVSIGDTDSDGPGSHLPNFVMGRAQIASAGEGKVLRYRIDGERLEPAGVLNSDPPVYAMGLRNPFDITCANNGAVVAIDNGPIGNDQVRLVEAGSNHEWPFSALRSLITPPLWDSGLSQLGPTGVAMRGAGADEEILVSSFHLNAIYALSTDHERVKREGVRVIHEGAAPLLAVAAANGCVFIADVAEIRVLAEPSCDAVPSVASSPPSRFSGSAESIYQANCASCHGAARDGGHGPALRAATLTGADEGYIATILGGRAGTVMPAWAALGLTVEQASALLDYLRSD